jgi:hypothetical protein
MHYDLYVVQVIFGVILNKDESVLEAHFGLTPEDNVDKQERKTHPFKVFHYLMICV